MKLRSSGREAEKIEPQMAPMIDVVFQLLIFFMLTLNIVEPEGDFNVNMPITDDSTPSDELPMFDIKVRLVANEDGSLNTIRLGQVNLGNGPNVFAGLNNEILKIIGRPGNPITKDMEVEIEADYNLHFEYTLKAVSACTGRLDSSGKHIIRYIEKIKFAPPVGGPAAGS
ncbi:ExbD/TolR family protein [Gimesia aquarii]|uniref:Biopolymer transport protein ExbD/TolR n=1 Tax=Gimesia aquarii TaxID=2527964 RepID=A0A517VR52_9PLAN|nr:biopolymer transporter ExbD [Gimesia aquarii]QDT95495.1 Biopolymer transport protein ExbD/TolR [Gimesia aquarii]